MVRMPWATYLWPGLPQLWYGGQWSGLVLAAGSAALVNGLLLASFVWLELLDPRQLWVAWLAAVVLWITSAAVSAWNGTGLGPHRATLAEAMFREALSEYLKGSWFEAERILGRLLDLNPRDAEARLLLATLLRHTERYGEAVDQLADLELLKDAGKWAWEIADEKMRIAQLHAAAVSATDSPSPTAAPQAA